MRPTRSTLSPRLAALALAALLAVSLTLVLAQRAAAAPPASLDLTQLQGLLDASPSGVDGTFDTVVGGAAGQLPVTIPMKVLSIVGGYGPDGALILFEADMADPVMARIGNIAMGMSGSPLYVMDGGHKKLIGALSYGDMFTLGGLGLATPIQYMLAIEAGHELGPAAAGAPAQGKAARPGRAARPTVTTKLAHPVRSATGATIRRIVVAPDAASAKAVAPAAGTAVFAPLEAVRIGGLPYASPLYQKLAAAVEARGHAVQRGLGAGPDGWDPSFTTPLVGGAALAAMYTNGDLWAGGIGTVTYVNGDHLLAFGHPMDWVGPTSLYLNNAYINGIWGSSLAAYKIGSPGSLRGTITQDRGSGIAGRLDQTPQQVPVTSSATVTTDVTRTARSSTSVTQLWADREFGSLLAAVAAGVAVTRASDAASLPGSATTTTTVVVSDGARAYTVTRDNLWDDPWDVQYVAVSDIEAILRTLTENPDGIAPATVRSVDLQATASTARRTATIADVSVAAPLRAGANVVRVSLNAYGVTEPLTVDVTLDLPAGTPMEGTISVAPAAASAEPEEGASGSKPATRQTLAQVVEALNAAPTNDMLEVTYTPGGGSLPPDSGASAPGPAPVTPVSATAHTGWVVGGTISKATAGVSLRARPAKLEKRGRVLLQGVLANVSADAGVRIYRRFVGATSAVLVATVPAPAGFDGATFSYRTGVLARSAVFTAVFDGDAATLAGSGSVRVTVRR